MASILNWDTKGERKQGRKDIEKRDKKSKNKSKRKQSGM
jgi:transposase